MESLNEYCLLHIFQNFSPKDRLNFSKVCSSWNEIMCKFWRLSKVAAAFYDISYVSLDRQPEYISPEDVLEIIRYSGSFLTEVSLIPMLNETNNNIRVQLDSHVYRTMNLTVHDMLDTLTEHCRYVKALKVYYSGDVKHYPIERLHKLFSCNEQLKSLEISCGDVGFLTNIMRLETLPSNLERLVLTSVRYETDNSFCAFLRQSKELQELKLIKVNPITDRCLQMISDFAPNLRVLHLHEERAGFFPQMKNISKLVNLEEFSVIGFMSSLTDSVIIEIVRCCKKIKDLSLSECQCITSIGMDIVVSSLPSLQTLQLRYLYVTSLMSRKSKSSLKTLKLHYCRSLSDDNLFVALQSMPCLTYLQIIDCFGLADCERLIGGVISTAIARNLVFRITEPLGSNRKLQVVVYRDHELLPLDKRLNNDSIFYMLCRPRSLDLLRLVYRHARSIPECKVSHEIVSTRYL